MSRSSFWLAALGCASLTVLAFVASSESSPPAHKLATGSAPFYLVASMPIAMPIAMPVAPTVPPPTLGIQTSVMPPAPPAGQTCSTITDFSFCSVSGTDQRCSALNENDNRCSTFASGGASCSTMTDYGMCSVRPPSRGSAPSYCSTFSQTAFHECSVTDVQPRQRCSVIGQGGSACSAQSDVGTASATAWCSVLNSGATSPSFCTVKAGQTGPSKFCSAFTAQAHCSVNFDRGKGACTAFGNADAGSCSAFIFSSECSLIGGPAGVPCSQ